MPESPPREPHGRHHVTTRVSVVIVTYNSAKVIGRCLEALVRSGPLVDIVVHDNASADDTVDVVRRIAPAATVIASPENGGFARGVNSAAAAAVSADVICLVNPDVVIDAESVVELANCALTDGHGVVAPLLRHPDGRLRVREGGRFPTVRAVVNHYSGLSSLSRRWPSLAGMYLIGDLPVSPTETDWVSGAVMAVSRDTWNRLGGLSERWFMYGEDIDFCYRVKQLDRSVTIRGDIAGLHDLGGSTGERPGSNPAWVVNLFDFYRRSMSPSVVHTAAWKVAMSVGLATRSLLFALRACAGVRDGTSWRHESSRFLSFAIAIAREPLQPVHTEHGVVPK